MDHLCAAVSPRTLLSSMSNGLLLRADCTDVDDVLSARQLDDGAIEIGVHIADVSAFVRPVLHHLPRRTAPAPSASCE